MTTSSETVSDQPDAARRDFLYLVTGSVAAVGVAATLWPFIAQMNPDAATMAAAGPVDIDISQIQPGQRVVTLWAQRPVFVVKRGQKALDELKESQAPRRNCATRIPRNCSSRLMRPTGVARSSRRFSFWLASAPTSAAFRCSTLNPMRPTRRPIGRAASSARATARSTIWPAACSRAFLRPTICRCRPIIFPTTRRCASAKIRRARISTSTRFCRSRPFVDAVAARLAKAVVCNRHKARTRRAPCRRRPSPSGLTRLTRSGSKRSRARPDEAGRFSPRRRSRNISRSMNGRSRGSRRQWRTSTEAKHRA